MSALGSATGYEILVERSDSDWRVRIVDAAGAPVGERSFRDAAMARTYASTVRQHRYWLSSERFRQYYGLPEPADGGP